MADSVDPRRVLQLINDMGYKNVSATELKEFTKGKFNGQIRIKNQYSFSLCSKMST